MTYRAVGMQKSHQISNGKHQIDLAKLKKKDIIACEGSDKTRKWKIINP